MAYCYVQHSLPRPFREVVERRTYTVTGQKASAEEIDRLIETGESETIFAKAILEQGRGHVRPSPLRSLPSVISVQYSYAQRIV